MSAIVYYHKGGTPLDHIHNASDQILRPLRRWPLRHQYSARGLPAAPRQRSVPHRRRSRAADAASRADKKGVPYGVVVDFGMNINDFLVTLNVTVSRMINWRNTASQIGHTVTNKTGIAVTVVMHFPHTEIIQ
jgi:hypothetical protein